MINQFSLTTASEEDLQSTAYFKNQTSTGGSVGFSESVLVFYYREDAITFKSETELVPFNALVSAVGGNLGLFLGFSCISLIEFGLKYFEARTKCMNCCLKQV